MYADETDSGLINEMLVGRSIVSADSRTGRLTLDNGTVLLVSANGGCGGCTSGFFRISSMEDFDNRIMNVSVVRKTVDGEDSGEIIYEIFVFGAESGSAYDDEEGGTSIATISGTLGNGYYGEGFTIEVEGWYDAVTDKWVSA